MSSTYTPSLQLQLIGNGDQSGTWGSTTNTNWTLAEQAIAGATTITMANANYTLTVANGATDQARNMSVIATGTNSGVYQVIAPLEPKIYNVVNNTTGGYAITFGASTGATVSIPNGYACFVYCDGTNFYPCDTSSGGNFYVNGTLIATSTATLEGNASVGGNLSVTGTTTLTGTTAAPTPSNGDNSTKIATTAFVSSAVQLAYPVGSIYMNASDSTNPATLLGFGTWSALAAGRMLMGNGGGFSAGGTGGYYAPQLLSHSHSASFSGNALPAHNHNFLGATPPGGGGGSGGGDLNVSAGLYTTVSSVSAGTPSGSVSVNSASSGDQTNGNLPPYLVVYMWVRTA